MERARRRAVLLQDMRRSMMAQQFPIGFAPIMRSSRKNFSLRFSKSVETPARNRVCPEKCGYGQGIDEQGDEIFDHKD